MRTGDGGKRRPLGLRKHSCKQLFFGNRVSVDDLLRNPRNEQWMRDLIFADMIRSVQHFQEVVHGIYQQTSFSHRGEQAKDHG